MVGGVVSLPLLVLMPDYSYRYGLQWLGFYFARSGCSALVFVQGGLRRDYLQFLRDCFPSEVIALLLVMIIGSVCVHGFLSQATAVLTMLMVMGTYPLLCFLWFIQGDRRDHLYLCIRIVLGVVLAEAIFLSCYQWLGLGMSSSDSLLIWP
ncbi:putative membrane protein [Synechococcus sp. WH 8103]|nr:putative membrane protein [Synechococcus sp. WH 8103]